MLDGGADAAGEGLEVDAGAEGVDGEADPNAQADDQAGDDDDGFGGIDDGNEAAGLLMQQFLLRQMNQQQQGQPENAPKPPERFDPDKFLAAPVFAPEATQAIAATLGVNPKQAEAILKPISDAIGQLKQIVAAHGKLANQYQDGQTAAKTAAEKRDRAQWDAACDKFSKRFPSLGNSRNMTPEAKLLRDQAYTVATGLYQFMQGSPIKVDPRQAILNAFKSMGLKQAQADAAQRRVAQRPNQQRPQQKKQAQPQSESRYPPSYVEWAKKNKFDL